MTIKVGKVGPRRKANNRVVLEAVRGPGEPFDYFRQYFLDDLWQESATNNFSLRNQCTRRVFIEFLDKFAEMQWRDPTRRLWKIEYGILVKACEILNKDPQEIERIMKVAKTKKDLKLHLGVS